MRSLRIAAITGMALLAQRAPATPSEAVAPGNTVADFVAEAARRFAIPESWIYAVMRVESAGNPRAVSSKGAAGLMQIMPATWLHLRIRLALGADIYDPHDNIIAGAGYLRELYDRYGSPGFLAAYNAGPARYEKYVARGVQLPDETIAYVRKLSPIAEGDAADTAPPIAMDPKAWTHSALFAGASRDAASGPDRAGSTSASQADPDARPRRGAGSLHATPTLFIALSGLVRR
jgi:soluble lytic murein transglycosylase-like protein